MVAAENDVLPNGKVGGIGDLVRDVPPALVARGSTVDVIIPVYHNLARLPGAEKVSAATKARFSWQASIDHYLKELYAA